MRFLDWWLVYCPEHLNYWFVGLAEMYPFREFHWLVTVLGARSSINRCIKLKGWPSIPGQVWLRNRQSPEGWPWVLPCPLLGSPLGAQTGSVGLVSGGRCICWLISAQPFWGGGGSALCLGGLVCPLLLWWPLWFLQLLSHRHSFKFLSWTWASDVACASH